MIKVENIGVFNFDGAIRGMRNPLNSWDRSDSKEVLCDDMDCCECIHCVDDECQSEIGYGYQIGHNDLTLMKRLYKGGSEHRKYLRQILVCMDITAPLYWWKEFDTYKAGTTSNSCSTMHKIQAKEFTIDDFSHEHINPANMNLLKQIINMLNFYRECYNQLVNSDNRKSYWWQMIQLLPTSYNQRRTITMNYENVMSMIHQREHHKLDEWIEFVNILKRLPYVEEIRGE